MTETKAYELKDRSNAVEADKTWVDAVRSQVDSVRFGLVQIVIHNGSVVQIEKTEKMRFNANDAR